MRAGTGGGGSIPGQKTAPRQAPAPAPAKPAGKPAPPANPAAGAPPPFLTPAQQQAWDNYQTSAASKINALNLKLGSAQAALPGLIAQTNLKGGQQTDTANQSMAARGLFQSSIRDAELNDIAAATTFRINQLHTNVNNLQLSTANDINTINAGLASMQQYYNSLGVSNAMGADPGTPPSTGSGGVTNPGSAGASKSGTTQAPVKPTNPASGVTRGSVGRSSGGASVGARPAVPRVGPPGSVAGSGGGGSIPGGVKG